MEEATRWLSSREGSGERSQEIGSPIDELVEIINYYIERLIERVSLSEKNLDKIEKQNRKKEFIEKLIKKLRKSIMLGHRKSSSNMPGEKVKEDK